MKLKVFLSKAHAGFSLVEMAVVLVILGFVLAALLLPLQAQRNQLFQTQTENQLEIAKKALIGFAQSRGRLPCPAIATSNGVEAPVGGSTCTTQLGFLPAATLGIQPADDTGFATDGWNNRIMYAVTQNSAITVPVTPSTPDFTSNIGDDAATPLINEADGMNVVGMSNLTPDLRVCFSSTGITSTTCSGGTESNYAINNAVAVIYSRGATGSQASGGADENINPAISATPKRVFISHDVVATGAANGEFDHLVVWLSPYVLYNAMIEAGQLH